MKSDIWGVFHDGFIKRLEGSVPGDVRLEIEIPYLRAMFDEPGDLFVIELQGCTQFQYTGNCLGTISKLNSIQDLTPEILFVNSEEPLVIDCNYGFLEMAYQTMLIRLPSGVSVSYEELSTATERYWQVWEEKQK